MLWRPRPPRREPVSPAAPGGAGTPWPPRRAPRSSPWATWVTVKPKPPSSLTTWHSRGRTPGPRVGQRRAPSPCRARAASYAGPATTASSTRGPLARMRRATWREGGACTVPAEPALQVPLPDTDRAPLPPGGRGGDGGAASPPPRLHAPPRGGSRPGCGLLPADPAAGRRCQAPPCTRRGPRRPAPAAGGSRSSRPPPCSADRSGAARRTARHLGAGRRGGRRLWPGPVACAQRTRPGGVGGTGGLLPNKALGPGQKDTPGRLLCPRGYSQPRPLSEGVASRGREACGAGREISRERNGCPGAARGLPEAPGSSARDRTGLSMPSLGLNSNFLQGDPTPLEMLPPAEGSPSRPCPAPPRAPLTGRREPPPGDLLDEKGREGEGHSSPLHAH